MYDFVDLDAQPELVTIGAHYKALCAAFGHASAVFRNVRQKASEYEGAKKLRAHDSASQSEREKACYKLMVCEAKWKSAQFNARVSYEPLLKAFNQMQAYLRSIRYFDPLEVWRERPGFERWHAHVFRANVGASYSLLTAALELIGSLNFNALRNFSCAVQENNTAMLGDAWRLETMPDLDWLCEGLDDNHRVVLLYVMSQQTTSSYAAVELFADAALEIVAEHLRKNGYGVNAFKRSDGGKIYELSVRQN
jgi:hypothetical protein